MKISAFRYNLRFLKLFFIFLLLGLIACAPKYPEVEEIRLNLDHINHAQFNSTGVFAVSAGQDIGVYQDDGSLMNLLSLPIPNGIWFVEWASPDLLYIYDRERLFRWHLTKDNVSEIQITADSATRLITIHGHNGLIAFEDHRLGALQFDDQQDTSEVTLNMLEFAESSTVQLGFTSSRNAFFALTKRGELYTWPDSEIDRAEIQNVGRNPLALLTSQHDFSQSIIALGATDNPLASENQISLHLLGNADELITRNIEIGVSVVENTSQAIVIGGTNNQWLAWSPVDQQWRSGALGKRMNPLKRSDIINVFEYPNHIGLLTSNGILQKWPKHLLVGE